MNVYRREISDFIRLAETLLSPVSLEQPLTQEECRVVDFYVRALAGALREPAPHYSRTDGTRDEGLLGIGWNESESV